jgi:hypothetical protein
MSSAIASFGLDGSRICRPTTQALRSLYPTGQSLFSFLQERSFLLKTSAANARTTCNFRYGLSHWCSLAFGYSKPVPLHICMSLAPPNLVTLVSLRLDPPMKLMKQLEHRTILHRQPRTQELTYQAKTLAALPLTESKTGQQETPAESLKRSKRLKLSVEQICGQIMLSRRIYAAQNGMHRHALSSAFAPSSRSQQCSCFAPAMAIHRHSYQEV